MARRDYRLYPANRPGGIPVLMCPDDGCFVLDTSIHEVWHAQLELPADRPEAPPPVTTEYIGE